MTGRFDRSCSCFDDPYWSDEPAYTFVSNDAISEYRGSMIIVSHDRYFLNRVATHMLAFEGTGSVHFHHGDYETYHEWKVKTYGTSLDNRASKYRKLHRE